MARGAGLTAAGPGALRVSGAAASAQPVRIQLEFTGSDSELWTALKKNIRIRGGNVTVLGD